MSGRATPTARSWDTTAALYDRQWVLQRRAIEAVIGLAEPRAAERLLDVGTGTGAVLRTLARVDPGLHEAIGIDPSAAMLAQVPKLPPRFSVVRIEGATLPFEAAHFDIVTCTYVLHVLDPGIRNALLREARRVLRPHGRIAVVTPWPRPGTPADRAWALADRAAARWPERLGGLHRHDSRSDLTAAGFALTMARPIRGGYPSLGVLAEAPG